MGLRRALLVGLTVAATAIQAAAAAHSRSTQFLVTMQATVSKQWTSASSTTTAGCTSRVTVNGTRTISLQSSDASIVSASWAGGGARAIFAAPVRLLAGSVTQSGRKTTRSSGPAPCSQGTHRLRCTRITRSFQDRSAELVSRRVHRLGFRPIRGLVTNDFFNSCPGEPSAVRAIAPGIELAGSRYSERELFDPATAAVTLQGSAEVTSTFLSQPATVIERVRWTLMFRRLGG
ncbi:MAG TPA: hypothetical protein VF002_00285 [Gaiellaceae bacterium]